MKILVVGGTGQTGPLIVEGLVAAGHEVVLLHSGAHEPPLPPVEHIHTDAHFAEPLKAALERRQFDLAICMYGRAEVVADALVGKTGRLISVSGTRYFYAKPDDPRWGEFGPWGVDETSPFSNDKELDRLGARVCETEQALMRHYESGTFDVTILRFPAVYGPHSIQSADWSFLRRILDGRSTLLLPDGGLMLRSRIYRDNAAHAVLLAANQPDQARGEIFHVADEPPELSLGQTIDAMARTLGRPIRFVGCPGWLAHRIYGGAIGFHRLLDTRKIRDRLGYRDKVPLAKALAETALWWRYNAPQRAGEVERTLGDKFDYALEDEILASLKASETALDRLAQGTAAGKHPYRHPRKPGEAWSEDTSGKLMNASLRYPYALGLP